MEFQEYLAKQMKDPEFQKAWEESEKEFQIILSALKSKNEKNLPPITKKRTALKR